MDFGKEIVSLLSHLKSYVGQNFDELSEKFRITTTAKSKNAILAKKLIDSYKGSVFGEALLKHESIKFKTIQVNARGIPNESMSFPVIDFSSLVKESWGNSTLREQLSKSFLLFVFKEDAIRKVFFWDAFLWRLPKETLDSEVKDTWEKTKEILLSGNVVSRIENDGKIVLNFPREKQTTVCHVRPHGRNGMDSVNIPKRDISTNFICLPKQSFWLNKKYLTQIIRNHMEGEHD